MTEKMYFTSDYMEGAHPNIMKRLLETNLVKSAGYGFDEYSASAKEKIRAACQAPQADIFFLAGGTQTNAVMIDTMLRPWQGVVAADSGHISVHEAGAIEYGGHKVLTLKQQDGKISASAVEALIQGYRQDENHAHMVMPGMVYLSQPTEFGTLYTLKELTDISRVCHDHQIPLYLDGARLAYALACPENDVSLAQIASLCDAFYIGGTKCGALFGEAVVIPQHDLIPHLFTMIKQHGALLAKGRIAGLQFDTLFTNGLYLELGQTAIRTAQIIREALLDKGYELAFPSPTNQIFPVLEKTKAASLLEKVEMGFWENVDETHAVYRIATSWATSEEEAQRLAALL